MAVKHQWIDRGDELAEFCETINDGDVVAIDTESDHFFAYRPFVALIQVATPAEAVLVDPLALDEEALDPLLAIVDDPAVIKIMHSARNDIGELDRDWGIAPANIFDTQLAARFLGYEKFGLDALLQKTAGVKLNKKYQRYDWSRRPIPVGPRDYAVEDVIHLFDLRDRLLRELEAEGWLRAFREQADAILKKSGHEDSPFDPEDWRRLKGSKDLDGPGRAVCAALFVFRHELCERLNRAPLHVFENSSLVRVARERPTSMNQLHSMKRLATKTVQYNGEEILRIVADAQHDDPPSVKRPRSGKARRREAGEKGREKTLLGLRQELGEQLRLPLDFVMSRRALEEIARIRPTDTGELELVEELLSWQVELFGRQLIDALR